MGSLVIHHEMTKVSAVPMQRQTIAFTADLCLVTFMTATPYC